MKSFQHFVAVLAVALAVTACDDNRPASSGAERAVTVFAASSLTDVMHKVGDLYEATGHPAPRFNFAASSALAHQIEQGGEADIFISADEAWMDYVTGKHLIDVTTRRTLLTNALVLVTPAANPIDLTIAPRMDLAAALKGGKLAIGDPDSVPAGKYAKEALAYYAAWTGVEAIVARSENVRAALRFVETGDAAAGIVYATDAMAAGASVLIVATFSEDSHTPITYPAAILAGKKAGVGPAFLDFLATDAAKKTFQEAGFGLK